MTKTHKQITKKLSGLRFSDIRLDTGVKMSYAEYGLHGGETILFIHGFTDSWFSFSPVLPYLPENYHVYMPDQRGHGDSSHPDEGYTIADFANDTIAFIEAMGLEDIILVGHSMGSVIAQRIAVHAPEYVRQLVLMGSTTDPRTEELFVFLEVVNALEDPVPAEFAHEFQTSTMYSELPDDFVEGVVAESSKLSANVWKSALTHFLSESALSPLEQIQAQTLIVWGEKDPFWLRDEQAALLKRIPNSKLLIYMETGHALHWSQAERFAQDLVAFVG